MKTSLITILMPLFCVLSALGQQKKEFIVLPVKPVKIKQKPLELNAKDTLNPARIFYPVEDELGGLHPRYPISKSSDKLNNSFPKYILCFDKSYFTKTCYNYIVEINNEIIEIYSKEMFVKIFAPVESKEEALSFAFALSDFYYPTTIYDFNFLNAKGTDYEIYRKELMPTSVTETNNGYEVILFSSRRNCIEKTIYVSKNGDVQILKSEKLFKDKNYEEIVE